MGMFSRFFGNKEIAPATIPEGQRVYAVGDIHGRDDLFADILARIVADSADRGEASVSIILLGDLIDRGPDSRAVVDRAIRLGQTGHVRALMGNHEEAFLKAMSGDEDAMEMLLRFGGDATLVSYGLSGLDVATLDIGSLLWQAASAVPTAHLDYMASMEDKIAIGDYLFVHAGVRPGVALDDQTSSDLRWIRDDFLKTTKHHGAMIVHGHSIVEEPEMLANRLGIDTGAYSSGRLTALGLEGSERWLLQTGSDQIQPEVR